MRALGILGLCAACTACSGKDGTTDTDTGTTAQTPPECRTYTQPIEVGGRIDVDTDWLCNTVPYVVNSDVVVADGAILTVGPGVTVQMASDTSIVVGNDIDGGGIVADGTARPILFTSSQGVQSDGDWEGIVIDTEATQAVFRNVTVEYAGDETQDGSAPGEGGIVVLGFAEIVDTTIVSSASHGVHFAGEGRATAFSGNTISDTRLDAIRIPAAQLGTLAGPNTLDTQIAVEGGAITADATWADVGAPYRVEGPITIDGAGEVVTVTMEAGTQWAFDTGAGIVVGRDDTGSLQALGAAGAPIVLTSAQATPAPGDWPGIQLDVNAMASVLDHVQLHFAGADSTGATQPTTAGLTVIGSEVTLTNSNVSDHRGHGVAFLQGGSAADLSGNDFGSNELADVSVPADTLGSLGANAFASDGLVEVQAGTVTTSATWQAVGAPCRLLGDVFVQGDGAAAVVTLQPGVTMQLAESAALVVGSGGPGGLVADAAGGDPILFTAVGSVKPGSWEAVVIDRQATEATFVNTVFEGGGDPTGDFNFAGEGALIVYDAAASVTDSTFRDNANTGLQLLGDASLTAFSGNTFTGHQGRPIAANASNAGALTGSHTFDAGDRVEVRPGTVETSATWSDIGIPFQVIGDVVVQGSGSPVLTLGAGLDLTLGGQVALVVGSSQPGGIVADGTADRITLRSTSTPGAAGDWESVVLEADALDSSLFRAVDFAHCGDPTSNTEVPFATCVGLDGVDASITDCTFTDSAGHAIELRDGASPTMSGNTFTNIAGDDVNGP